MTEPRALAARLIDAAAEGRAIEALTASKGVISHWSDEIDEWVQVDPPLSGQAAARQAAVAARMLG